MANRKLNSEMMKKKSKKEGEKRAEVKLFERLFFFPPRRAPKVYNILHVCQKYAERDQY